MTLSTLSKMSRHKINHTKTEQYTIPKPPPPPPPPPAPTIEELLAHKDDKVCWSALDWLVHYEPPPVKDDTPDWHSIH